VCEYCGETFEDYPYLSKSEGTYRRKYCSLKCKHQAWGRIMTAKRLAKAET
jgi:hypothetical protein